MTTYREVLSTLSSAIEKQTNGGAKSDNTREMALRGTRSDLRQKIGLPRFASPKNVQTESAPGFGQLDTEIPEETLGEVRAKCKELGLEI